MEDTQEVQNSETILIERDEEMKEESDAFSTLEKPLVNSQETENMSQLVEEKVVLPSLPDETKTEPVEMEISASVKQPEREGSCYWLVYCFIHQ